MTPLERVAAFLNRDGWRAKIEPFGQDEVLRIIHPLTPDRFDHIHHIDSGYWWLFGAYISRDPEQTARHVESIIGRTTP